MAAGREGHPPSWSRGLRRFFRPFLSRTDKARILAAIDQQEARTTGRISVHVIARAGRHDILALARHLFVTLGLDRTAGRNGVLILVSHLDHQFAIWGDQGLQARIDDNGWRRAGQVLSAHFAERRYANGIEACVREVGETLAREFPGASVGDRREQGTG